MTLLEAPARRGQLHQIDIVRLLTFGAVIGVHAIAFTESPTSRAWAGVLMLLQFGREVFFALTGFVLVYSARGRAVTARAFWRKRFPAIAAPYLAWSAIYTAFHGTPKAASRARPTRRSTTSAGSRPAGRPWPSPGWRRWPSCRAISAGPAALVGCLWRAGPASTVAAVSHGLALQGAIGVLAAHGLVHLDDTRPPHLGNGEWIVLPVVRGVRRHDQGYAA